jgi:UDP-N-acetylglucosamine--N-acetylmuramyl-(pentapeptide) pyrophosphoryl-undecaprenol N-acetylglucosamine transferase
MKIIFTGGGSGGHFYPIIAIAQEIRNIVKKEKLIEPKMYFLAPTPYNKGVLYDNDIQYKKILAGKRRTYASPLNFFDGFKTFFGIIKAMWTVFWIFPDVIFSKGGFGSFPVTVAARILRIPLIVHESDSAPGRANAWAAKFAEKIAVSYADAGAYFKHKERIAWTGNPIREEIKRKAPEGGYEFLDLDPKMKTILVLGGSLGAKHINEAIIDVLPEMLEKYQIVHQTGKANYDEVVRISKVVAPDANLQSHYKPFPYLNDVAMRVSAGIADLIITRAGSTLFEVANWGTPAIVIPITDSNGDHQRKNAFAYARAGAGVVIEENNLTPTVLKQEINRILEDPLVSTAMVEGAKEFAKPDAARTLAEAIIETVLRHEK